MEARDRIRSLFVNDSRRLASEAEAARSRLVAEGDPNAEPMEVSEFEETPPAGSRGVHRTIGDDDEDLDDVVELVVAEAPQEPKAFAAAPAAPAAPLGNILSAYSFYGGTSESSRPPAPQRLGGLGDKPKNELKARPASCTPPPFSLRHVADVSCICRRSRRSLRCSPGWAARQGLAQSPPVRLRCARQRWMSSRRRRRSRNSGRPEERGPRRCV